MNLPSLIKVRLTADGKPLGGLMIVVRIIMSRKNDFGLAFGPSDAEGRIEIRRDDLLREADKERQLFLMDYGDPEADFTGKIVVDILSRPAVERALKAYQFYRNVSSYTPEYEKNLQDCGRTLERLYPKIISMQLEAEGGKALVGSLDH